MYWRYASLSFSSNDRFVINIGIRSYAIMALGKGGAGILLCDWGGDLFRDDHFPFWLRCIAGLYI